MKTEEYKKAEDIVLAWIGGGETAKPVMGDLIDAIVVALREARAAGLNEAPLQKELAEFNRHASDHNAHKCGTRCVFCAMYNSARR